MRRRNVVHEAQGMLNKADAIDDKLAVLVTSDGLPEPRGLRIFAVLAVEINPAHLMVAFPDHPDLVRCLDEIEGLKERQLTRCAAGPAARLRREGTMAVLHQVVVHSYLGGCPEREIRILVHRPGALLRAKLVRVLS